MTITENACTECGNVVQTTTQFCPDCGAEDPWEEQPAYEFDEDDLPFVFSHEYYDDHGDLWRSFVADYFGYADLKESDIAGIPGDFPQMEYCVVDLHYVVTESHELEGPFLDRSKAREVADDS